MSERFNCLIEAICPLHIGCDEVYEPMSFVVNEKTNQLIAFDLPSFVSNLAPEDRQRLSQVCSKGTIGSLLEVYRFFKGRNAEGIGVDLANGFLEHYRKTLDLRAEEEIKRELNRFVIFRTSFHPIDSRPYVPGSALKGAIRTAYLNSLAKEREVPTPEGKNQARELEEALLEGSFDTDPFRFVKVSDFMPIGAVKARIVYAVNEKKRQSSFQARGPFQILETIEPGSRFHGSIVVDVPHSGAGIHTSVSLQNLLRSLASFYTMEKTREDGELRSIGVRAPSHPPSGQYLVRLGRHSGAECVTIAGFRDIKIMKNSGEKAAWGKSATTLWLASEVPKPKIKQPLRPFGWAVLREMTKDDISDFEVRESSWQDEISHRRSPVPPVVTISRPLPGEKQPAEPRQHLPRETWERAILTFRVQDGTIIASYGSKRPAETKDKSLVPEEFHKRLFDKRKNVTATVEVEKLGNAFRIVRIE